MHPEFNIRDFLDTKNMSAEEIDRCEFWVNANRLVRESEVHNYKKERIPVNTNWNLEVLEEMLCNYEDKEVLEFIKFGWPLNADNMTINSEKPKNQAGANAHPTEIDQYIKTELEYGAIIGPFDKNPFGPEARFLPIDT